MSCAQQMPVGDATGRSLSIFERAPAIVRATRRLLARTTVNRATVMLTASIALASLTVTFLSGLLVGAVQPYMLLVATIVPIVTAGPATWFTCMLVWQLDRSERLHAHLARHDALTGLLGRRAFFVDGTRRIAQCRVDARECWALMADLDRFKRINDAYGHAAGDEALRQIARRCREVVRPIDIVGRYGGDELVALLVDVDRAGAQAIAEQLRESLMATRLDLGDGREIAATTSIGLARVDAHDHELDAPLRRADDALREAKAQGRNRVVVAGM